MGSRSTRGHSERYEHIPAHITHAAHTSFVSRMVSAESINRLTVTDSNISAANIFTLTQSGGGLVVPVVNAHRSAVIDCLLVKSML